MNISIQFCAFKLFVPVKLWVNCVIIAWCVAPPTVNSLYLQIHHNRRYRRSGYSGIQILPCRPGGLVCCFFERQR